jgi:hypothetical protein
MANENKHLLINIAKLADIAKKDQWVVEYDNELDSFYWTKPSISKDAQLTRFSDEFALYVTPKGNIEGLFIEYAQNNFVTHHQTFKPLFENLIENAKSNLSFLNTKDSKIRDLLECMAGMVANDTLAEVLEKDISLKQVFA